MTSPSSPALSPIYPSANLFSPGTATSRRPLATFGRPGILAPEKLPLPPVALRSSAPADFRRALERSRRLPSHSFSRRRPLLRGHRHPLHLSPLPALGRERCFFARRRLRRRRRTFSGDALHRESSEGLPPGRRHHVRAAGAPAAAATLALATLESSAGDFAAAPLKFMFRPGRRRRRQPRPRHRRPGPAAGGLRPGHAPFLFEAWGQRSPLAGEGFFPAPAAGGPSSPALPSLAYALAEGVTLRGRELPGGGAPSPSPVRPQLLALLTLGRLPRRQGRGGISSGHPSLDRTSGKLLGLPGRLPRRPLRRALAYALAFLLPALARSAGRRREAVRSLAPLLARRRGFPFAGVTAAALVAATPPGAGRRPGKISTLRSRRRAPRSLGLAGGTLARRRLVSLALPAPRLGELREVSLRRRRLLGCCLRRRRFPSALRGNPSPGLRAPARPRRRLQESSLWSPGRRRWLRRRPLARRRRAHVGEPRRSPTPRAELATFGASWHRLLAGAPALPGAGESWSQRLRRRSRLATLPPGPAALRSSTLFSAAPRAFAGRSRPAAASLAFGQRLLLAGVPAPGIFPAAAEAPAASLAPALARSPGGERLLRRGWNPPLGSFSPGLRPQPAFAAGQSASRRSQRVRAPLLRHRRDLALRRASVAFRRALLEGGSRRLGRRRSVRAALREVAERRSRQRPADPAGNGSDRDAAAPSSSAGGEATEEVTPRRSRALYGLLRRRLRQPRLRRLRRRSAALVAAAGQLQGRPGELAPTFEALATLRRRSAALVASALVALPSAESPAFAALRQRLLAATADGLALEGGRLGGLSPRGRWSIHGFTPYWELDDRGNAPFRREFAHLEEGLLSGSPGLLTFLPGESNGSSLGLGQLPRSHSLWLFRSKLFWYYLAVIISPRRNNVRCTVQPQGGPLAVRNRRRLVHLSAGLLPGHRRGRQRRSLETRRELYRRAAFRLLRFAKYRSHYRFLLFKTPHLLAGLGDRRSPGGLHWDLRQIFGPFVERRLYKLLPPAEAWSVRSTPPHFGASRLGQPRRSRKHPPRLKRLSF